MRITDPGEDVTSQGPRSSIMDSIKAKSQFVKPADDDTVPKISADVQSTKLKQLLGQIKQA